MKQPSGAPVPGHDLEFTTTVDGSVQQNVPLPSAPPQTNSVLSGMIASANTNASAGPSSYSSSPLPSAPSYTPSSPLPSALQFAKSDHPAACLFHILFKGLALLLYVLGSKFMEDILVTVLCILLLAADFWVVKNITGRLLVGLRWWNRVDPVTGNTNWIFESASPTSPDAKTDTNTFDSKYFWGVLYLTPVLWAVFTLSAVLFLKFQCFVTLATAMVLSSSNVYGYYKCSADQREKWNQWMNRGAQMGVSAMFRNGMFGWLGNRMAGGGGGVQPVPQQDPNTMPGTFA